MDGNNCSRFEYTFKKSYFILKIPKKFKNSQKKIICFFSEVFFTSLFSILFEIIGQNQLRWFWFYFS